MVKLKLLYKLDDFVCGLKFGKEERQRLNASSTV